MTRITVVAETAKAYADVCSAGRQIAIAQRSVALQTRSTQLTRELFQTGRGISLDVTRAKALEDRVRASIPPLEAAQKVALYRLTVLTGRPPEEFPISVVHCADEPRLVSRFRSAMVRRSSRDVLISAARKRSFMRRRRRSVSRSRISIRRLRSDFPPRRSVRTWPSFNIAR